MGIALISICVFPLVVLALLFAMDIIHLNVGLSNEAKEKTNVYLRKYQPKQDEAEVNHMKTLEAIKVQNKNLERKKTEINRDIERLENLKVENSKVKDEILVNRNKIEKLISNSETMNQKRMKALAEVYGSMRPEEAAPILLTLQNSMVAQILRLIPEIRAQSKLMGAIGHIDVKRAASISKIMGRVGSKG